MKYKTAFESLAIFSLVILVISAASSFNFVSDESSEIIPNAYALKSKGVYNTEINSKLVCGDRLCSEIDGGRTTFEVEMKLYGQEEPQVKVSLIEKEEPKPTPVIAHGKILDDFGNVIGTF